MLVELASAWDYTSHGVNWADSNDPDFDPTCVLTEWQSPINIARENAYPVIADEFPPLTGFCSTIEGKVRIGDYSLKLETLDGKADLSNYITGGPLNNATFYFLSMDLHWGNRDCPGSEHTIDRNRLVSRVIFYKVGAF